MPAFSGVCPRISLSVEGARRPRVGHGEDKENGAPGTDYVSSFFWVLLFVIAHGEGTRGEWGRHREGGKCAGPTQRAAGQGALTEARLLSAARSATARSGPRATLRPPDGRTRKGVARPPSRL